MGYEWEFRFLWHYLPALLKGSLVTLELTGIAVVGGTVLGIMLTGLRTSRVAAIRWLTRTYTELGLALPLLVLIVWMKYCAPQLSGRFIFDEFTVASIAMIINLAPFVSETIRSGLATLPTYYSLAARAVGMSGWQTFRRITFPLALRRTLPGLIAHYVTTLKLASVCSIIAVPEIVYTSSAIISREFRPLEVYTVMALIYVALVLPFTMLVRLLENTFLVKN